MKAASWAILAAAMLLPCASAATPASLGLRFETGLVVAGSLDLTFEEVDAAKVRGILDADGDGWLTEAEADAGSVDLADFLAESLRQSLLLGGSPVEEIAFSTAAIQTSAGPTNDSSPLHFDGNLTARFPDAAASSPVDFALRWGLGEAGVKVVIDTRERGAIAQTTGFLEAETSRNATRLGALQGSGGWSTLTLVSPPALPPSPSPSQPGATTPPPSTPPPSDSPEVPGIGLGGLLFAVALVTLVRKHSRQLRLKP